METANEDVEKFLDETLHNDDFDVTPAPAPENVENDSSICENLPEPCLPGICKNDPSTLWESTSAFAKTFQQALDERNIKTGSFLVLSSPDYPLTLYFFLGVILRRPLLQTVVLADVLNDRISFQKDGNGQPQFDTSCHLFATFLHATSKDLKELNFEHWVYTPRLEDGQRLVVCADQMKSQFVIGLTKHKAQSKPSIKLPFGLSNRNPKKKRHATAQSGKSGPKPKHRRIDKTASGSGSGDSRSSDSEDPVPKGSVANTEQVVEPITAIVAQSEVDARTLEKEVEDSDQVKAILAEEVPQTRGGSFFSKVLGVGTGAIAPTGRSKCRHCSKFIMKDEIRFEWFWNKLRPPSWVHAHCLMSLADASQLRQETLESLRRIASTSSGSRDDNPVSREAARILSLTTV